MLALVTSERSTLPDDVLAGLVPGIETVGGLSVSGSL
jgi:hypothetical protein